MSLAEALIDINIAYTKPGRICSEDVMCVWKYYGIESVAFMRIYTRAVKLERRF